MRERDFHSSQRYPTFMGTIISWLVKVRMYLYTERDSKIGSLARKRPEFEPGFFGAEVDQLE